MPKQSFLPASALILCAALYQPGYSQSVAPKPEEASRTEVIQLSPFEVNTSQDVGYVAANSLTGSRADTELKFTPAAISVMTSEFLDDIGATNLRDSLEWANNYVVSPEVNTTGLGGFSNTFRNMGSTFATRNFFLWYVESDAYNTERYEFARGPNGVLFGDGGAGGIATTWTKRPRFGRAFRTVNLRANTFDGWRASIDINQPAGDRFALRLNAVTENAPAWRDHTHNKRDGIHLAGVVRLTSRNSLRFEAEKGSHDRSIYANYIIDQVSNWNGSTVYDGTAAPSTAGTGLARISSRPWMLYIPGTPNGGFNDWSTFYQTTGTGLGLMPNGEVRTDIVNSPVPPPKGFNYTPTDILGTLDYHTYTVYLDHRFNDNLFIELAYNRLRNIRNANGQSGNNSYNLYRVDVNRILPGGGTNPDFGKAFTDTQPILLLGENWVNDYRALANWRYQNKWFRGSASVIAGSRPERYHAFTKLLRRNNGPVANLADVSNQVRVRRYWDQAGEPLGEISIPGTFYDTTSEAHQRKQIDYGQIATITQFFNERLTVLVGARRDHYEQEQLNLGSTVPLVTDVSTNSKNYGAVYYLMPWLGVFANYSETFQAPNSGNALLDGSPPGISRGKGNEYGVKLQLLDGKITGSFNYYDSKQAGRLQNGGNLTQINRIWTNLSLPTVADFRDTNDLAGKGYEFEVTANIMHGLR
ncbi:MAG: TonB-dependent receptor, partial [Opitutaceae bacterium]|nr:TonB-dependent receptor [Opitutaceae bacterium]